MEKRPKALCAVAIFYFSFPRPLGARRAGISAAECKLAKGADCHSAQAPIANSKRIFTWCVRNARASRVPPHSLMAPHRVRRRSAWDSKPTARVYGDLAASHARNAACESLPKMRWTNYATHTNYIQSVAPPRLMNCQFFLSSSGRQAERLPLCNMAMGPKKGWYTF